MKTFIALLFTCSAAVAQPMTFRDSAFESRISRLLDGLQGYWKLEESTGLRYDKSKNGYHLYSFNGPTTTSGVVRNCQVFASTSSQFISLTNTPFLDGGNSNWTIGCWVYLASKPAANQTYGIISKDQTTSTRSYSLQFVQSADRFRLSVFDGTSTGVATVDANSFGSPSLTTWNYLLAGYDLSQQKAFISVNGGTVDYSSAASGTPGTSNSEFAIGSDLVTGFIRYLDGRVDEVGYWSRLLNTNEVKILTNQVTFPMFRHITSGLTIDNPYSYTVFQRTAQSNAVVRVTGSVGSGTHTIEARFNGGSWTAIQTNATVTYSGTFTANQGQGSLDVRWADNTAIAYSVENIGIGDVFAVAGQSNAVGYGYDFHSYSNSGVFASMFANDYRWKNLTDPTDNSTGQVDAVSYDFPNDTQGSVWPLLASYILTNQLVPVAFVPCALGGSGVSAWLPSGSSTNRASLYGSMVWRSKYEASGIKSVLWWQGEHDAALTNSQSYYYTNYTNYAGSFLTDAGVKTMPCKFQNCTGTPLVQLQPIWNAIGQAWSNDPSTIAGPDLSDIDSDDGSHLRTTAKQELAASRWWSALQTAFY